MERCKAGCGGHVCCQRHHPDGSVLIMAAKFETLSNELRGVEVYYPARIVATSALNCDLSILQAQMRTGIPPGNCRLSTAEWILDQLGWSSEGLSLRRISVRRV